MLNNIVTNLENATAETPLAPELVMAAMQGYQMTQVIVVATKLGIFQNLGSEKKNLCDLAASLNVNKVWLDDLLEMLCSLSLLRKENGLYEVTTLGEMLTLESPRSFNGTVLSIYDTFRAWGSLYDAYAESSSGFKKAFGVEMYDFLNSNKGSEAAFANWMKESHREKVLPLLRKVDLGRHASYLDLGGSQGALASYLSKEYPNARVTVFERQSVVDVVEEEVYRSNVRYDFVAGDFFDLVPDGHSAYFLSRVLLNWSDADAIQILRNVKKALGEDSKLYVIDFMLPDNDRNASQLIASLHLIAIGGRNMRREQEYLNMFSESGFEKVTKLESHGHLSLYELS
ncbi:methyltransferase [Vibrio sp. TRT 17S01]|uniref:methyltransferase n=1 Tax=Vibrio sp. TRT 17S01 TaxID=3418505 RepID=UPI003CEDC52E